MERKRPFSDVVALPLKGATSVVLKSPVGHHGPLPSPRTASQFLRLNDRLSQARLHSPPAAGGWKRASCPLETGRAPPASSLSPAHSLRTSDWGPWRGAQRAQTPQGGRAVPAAMSANVRMNHGCGLDPSGSGAFRLQDVWRTYVSLQIGTECPP